MASYGQNHVAIAAQHQNQKPPARDRRYRDCRAPITFDTFDESHRMSRLARMVSSREPWFVTATCAVLCFVVSFATISLIGVDHVAETLDAMPQPASAALLSLFALSAGWIAAGIWVGRTLRARNRILAIALDN